MQVNTQKPMKLDTVSREKGDLLVHEVFYTIQGEGPFAGSTAVFVRLAGCNLQCPACDTQYTGGDRLDIETLLDTVKQLPGGEPLRQNIDPFAQLAMLHGYEVQIETNGTLPYPVDLEMTYGMYPTIVCSPKTSKVHKDLIPLVDAWKYVLEDGYINERGLPTRALQGKQGIWQDFEEGSLVYVQPIDTQNAEADRQHLASTVASALQHGHRLCLQVHKIANLP